jgi:hypothetical protein
MPTLTIELTPEVYERLHAEAQRQGKAEQETAQELLASQLILADNSEVPLYIRLWPQICALAANMKTEDFVVPPRGTPQDAIRLLQKWNEEDAACADEEEEGEGTWEDILRAIDANRFSYRKLFPELEQPE